MGMWFWDLGRGFSFGISDGDVGFWGISYGDVVLVYRMGMWVFGGISYGDVVLGISNGDDEEEAVAMAEEIL